MDETSIPPHVISPQWSRSIVHDYRLGLKESEVRGLANRLCCVCDALKAAEVGL